MFCVSALCLHCAWRYNQAGGTFSYLWILRKVLIFLEKIIYLIKTTSFYFTGGKVIHQMQFGPSFTFFPTGSAVSCITWFPPMKVYWRFGCADWELSIAQHILLPISSLNLWEGSGWREMVGIICLHFWKDFSKVLHRKLLWELSGPEVRGKGLPWIRN